MRLYTRLMFVYKYIHHTCITLCTAIDGYQMNFEKKEYDYFYVVGVLHGPVVLCCANLHVYNEHLLYNLYSVDPIF